MWAANHTQAGEHVNELLSLRRMARQLGITQAWLREQADTGKVPCLKAGNHYLFHPPTVERILADRASGAAEGMAHA